MRTHGCPSETCLTAFVLGKLPDDEALQLAEHASDCPACQAELERVDRLSDDLLVQMQQTPLPDALTSESALSHLLPRIENLGDLLADRTSDSPIVLNGPPGESKTDPISFLAPPQAADELGRLGGYRVLKTLGRGGMGVVFLAHDPKADRQIALKVMLPETARSLDARERFLREARATAAIEHDHIVPLYQVSEDRGVPFLVMPLLKGATLEDWLIPQEKRQKRIPVKDVLRLGREIALGLAAAHARGLIHRDVKPANLWLDAGADDRVKILDFGLARPVGDVGLTQQGAVVGTAAYMAPEQAKGETLDHRVDLYSLGCVLYRLCAGRLPFLGNDAMSVLIAATSDEPTPVDELNPALPAPLASLVMQLLAKNPADRPATARDVAARIQNLERQLTLGAGKGEPAPPLARSRWSLQATAAASFLLAGVVGLYVFSTPKSTPQPGSATEPTASVLAQGREPTPAVVVQAPAPTKVERPPEAEVKERVKAAWHLQIQAVNARMKTHNPGFESLERQKSFWLSGPGLDATVRKVEFCSDAVADLSPLSALTDLANLSCAGSKPGLGKVTDLRPLRDLKLIHLNVSCTDVHDLSPLVGMSETLTHLNIRSTHVRSFTPLKQLTHLIELDCDPPTTRHEASILAGLEVRTINGQPKRDFLKTLPPALLK